MHTETDTHTDTFDNNIAQMNVRGMWWDHFSSLRTFFLFCFSPTKFAYRFPCRTMAMQSAGSAFFVDARRFGMLYDRIKWKFGQTESTMDVWNFFSELQFPLSLFVIRPGDNPILRLSRPSIMRIAEFRQSTRTPHNKRLKSKHFDFQKQFFYWQLAAIEDIAFDWYGDDCCLSVFTEHFKRIDSVNASVYDVRARSREQSNASMLIASHDHPLSPSLSRP